MLIHQTLVWIQRLQRNQDCIYYRRCHNSQLTESSEKVQRPAHVLEQKPYRQQIEEHPKSTPDAVVALALFAVHIPDRNLANRRAIPTGQSRNEAVHFAI